MGWSGNALRINRLAPLSGSLILTLVLMLLSACDHGIIPPESTPLGSIEGAVTYTGPWPASDSLFDIRFIALRFVPTDTSAILQAFQNGEIIFSDGLQRRVASDSFRVNAAETGPWAYVAIAVQASNNILDWVPVGLYAETAGIMQVQQNTTTRIRIDVDFTNRPPFPPHPLP